jgi:hypothetical protein
MTALVPCPRHLVASLVGRLVRLPPARRRGPLHRLRRGHRRHHGKRVCSPPRWRSRRRRERRRHQRLGFRSRSTASGIGRGAPLLRGGSHRAASSAAHAQLMGLRLVHAHRVTTSPATSSARCSRPLTIELLPGSSSLADGQGITGEYRSASFRFAAPRWASSPRPGRRGGARQRHGGERRPRAHLRGERDARGGPRHLRGARDLGVPVHRWDRGRRRHGGPDPRPALWLDQVDFSREPTWSAGRRSCSIRPRSPRTFVRGLKKAPAYAFSVTPTPESS